MKIITDLTKISDKANNNFTKFRNLSGIYKIRNLINDKLYIGSSKCFYERWRRHLKDLRKNKHHSQYLQKSYNKHGENMFVFEVLEYCKITDLAERENAAFKLYSPEYNICLEAYSQIGRKLSEEHIEKIRKYVRENNVRPPIVNELKIQMLDYNTLKVIEEFDSITKACIAIGKTNQFVSTLSSCCKGKRKSAFGYKWKFK